jgi:hypothetical protein
LWLHIRLYGATTQKTTIQNISMIFFFYHFLTDHQISSQELDPACEPQILFYLHGTWSFWGSEYQDYIFLGCDGMCWLMGTSLLEDTVVCIFRLLDKDGSSRFLWNIISIYLVTQCHIPEDHILT